MPTQLNPIYRILNLRIFFNVKKFNIPSTVVHALKSRETRANDNEARICRIFHKTLILLRRSFLFLNVFF